MTMWNTLYSVKYHLLKLKNVSAVKHNASLHNTKELCLMHKLFVVKWTESSCENGFVYNSTCYKIHRERVNWFIAVNRCLSDNGSLAVFDDHVSHIPTDFRSHPLTEGPHWIGLVKSWWTWPDAGLSVAMMVVKLLCIKLCALFVKCRMHKLIL